MQFLRDAARVFAALLVWRDLTHPHEMPPAAPPRPAPQPPVVHLRPGWNALPPEPLPQPTYWPAVMAAGIMAIFWGIVTSWIITVTGIVLSGISIAGWIGDLLNADGQHETERSGGSAGD